MQDHVVKALAHQGHIRLMMCDVTQTAQKIKTIHDSWPLVTVAFGRMIAMTSLLAANLKNDQEHVAAVIRGDGPIGQLRVEADGKGHIRGLVSNSHVHLVNDKTHRFDLTKAFGKGQLTVIRSMELAQDFSSTIDLVNGEIGDDFLEFFSHSEQVPSGVSVACECDRDGNVKSAGAILIQMMPGHDATDIQMSQHVLEGLKPVSQILSEGQKPSEVLSQLFDDVEILETLNLEAACSCSKEKMIKALLTIPRKDLWQMLIEDPVIEMTCQYCLTNHKIDKDDIIQAVNA